MKDSLSFKAGDLTIIVTVSDSGGETTKGFLSSLKKSSFLFSFACLPDVLLSVFEANDSITYIYNKYNLSRLYVSTSKLLTVR